MFEFFKVTTSWSRKFSGLGIWITKHAYEPNGLGVYLGFLLIEIQPKRTVRLRAKPASRHEAE